MQNNRVYSAASLTDVINTLKQYRLSGILTIRPASDPYREEVRISVELGQPLQIRRGPHEEHITNATLFRLHNWGMIYFTFQNIEPTLQLPAPQRAQPPSTPSTLQPSHLPHTPVPPTVAASYPQARYSPSVTRPLPAITPEMIRERAESYSTHPTGNHRATGIPDTPLPGTQTDQNAPPDYSSTLLFNEALPRLALEMAVAFLTPAGKNYPIAQIPRYDRMIYLLINGRRTIADLAQLTKRSLEEVCNSLYRLKQQDLIAIHI